MAKAPVDIPVQVSGLSDLQKLERRMEALEKEIARLNKQTPKAANNVKKLGASARGASAGVKTLGTAIKSTLAPLIAATSAMAGLTAGFQQIASLDFSGAKLRSLGVDSEALVANLKEVSVELKGNASVAELAAAAYDVASAGFTDAADAAKVLKAASLGATGGFSDINTVGDAATSVLNAYGKSAAEAGRLVDGFIQTQNDGKIVVDEYARNIGKVASAAAGLKIPIEEVNAVIAQSTAAGVQSEIAFTGLKVALTRLASGEAANSLKKVGININAATLEADGLLGTLKKLEGLDTGQILKALGTEGGPALLPVIQNLERFEELLENQENAAGAAQRAQEEAANTINGAWTRVRVAFENLFTNQAALAQAIIPILDGVATKINEIAKAVEGWKSIIDDLVKTFNNLKAALPKGKAFDAIANGISKIGEIASTVLFPLNALLDKLVEIGVERNNLDIATTPDGADQKRQKAKRSATNMEMAARGFVPDGQGGYKKPDPLVIPKFESDTEGTNAAAETAKMQSKLTRELEKQQRIQDDAVDAALRQTAAFADQLRSLEDQKQILEGKLNGTEREARLAIQIRDATEGLPAPMAAYVEERLRGIDALKQEVELQGELNDELTEGEQLLSDAYGIIAGSLTSSIKGLIAGTKEWGDVLSDILGQLGSMFLNAGMKGLGVGLGIPGFDGGGYTGNGSRSGGVDGKGGFPAILHPQETVIDHTSPMSRYGGSSSGGVGGAVPTFRLETEVINNVEYATVAQVRAMGNQAAQRGAAGGHAKTMNTLQNNRSSRARLGMS